MIIRKTESSGFSMSFFPALLISETKMPAGNMRENFRSLPSGVK
jgi:hypothetical protein